MGILGWNKSKKSSKAETNVKGDELKSKFLFEARQRFEQSYLETQYERVAATEDVQFAHNIGEGQWRPEWKKERDLAKRPALTINKLSKILRKAAAEMMLNMPAIKVRPVDSNTDPEKAGVMNGLIRSISSNSRAKKARITAYKGSTGGGFGYYRIIHKYEGDETFDQCIEIQRITNPLTVYLDPYCKEFNCSDGRFGFISEEMDRDEFIARYPGVPMTDWTKADQEELLHRWFGKDTVRVAEYYYVEPVEKTLVKLEDGKIFFEDDVPEELKETAKQTRKVVQRQVMWCKMNASEIIEGPQEVACKYIPIVAVWGEEVNNQGRRVLKSLIRDAKEPQMIYNYWRTAATEWIASAPQSPYLVDARQIAKYKTIWDNMNLQPTPYLPYEAVPGMEKPARIQPPQIPAAAITEARIAEQDIADVTAQYEAAQGAPGNERSALAIKARQGQSALTSYEFVDNLIEAMIFEGMILVDMIPRIYDGERQVRILGEDGKQSLVTINETVTGDDGEPKIIYDLGQGRYDVVVDVGPSYPSKRAETADLMIKALQYVPSLGPGILDLIFKYMDAPGVEELVTRIQEWQKIIAQQTAGQKSGEEPPGEQPPPTVPVA